MYTIPMRNLYYSVCILLPEQLQILVCGKWSYCFTSRNIGILLACLLVSYNETNSTWRAQLKCLDDQDEFIYQCRIILKIVSKVHKCEQKRGRNAAKAYNILYSIFTGLLFCGFYGKQSNIGENWLTDKIMIWWYWCWSRWRWLIWWFQMLLCV